MGACMSNGSEHAVAAARARKCSSDADATSRPEPYQSYSFLPPERVGGGLEAYSPKDKYQTATQTQVSRVSVTPQRPINVYDRYRFVRKLEDTHFGSVWEGEDIHRIHGGDGRVAVKESKKTSALNKRHCRSKKTVPEDVDMEIKIHQMAMNDRNCPDSIIRIHDVIYSDQTNIYMIMEFGDGGSLLDHLQNQQFPNHESDMGRRHRHWKADVKRWFKDICLAVEFLHVRNICHKDLSLQNLLLKTNGSRLDVKIVDFGLAERFPYSDPQRKCTTRAKVGKSNFASPECYSSKVPSFDAKANDCWCLGVILFMCLTQCSPFENPLDDNARTLHKGAKYIRRNLRRWRKSHLVDNMELDLLACIFRNESCRFNIQQILEHPYLSQFQEKRRTRVQTPDYQRRQIQDDVTWEKTSSQRGGSPRYR